MINLQKLDELNLIEQLNHAIDMALELKELNAPDFIIVGVEDLLEKALFILTEKKASNELIELWFQRHMYQVHGCYFAFKWYPLPIPRNKDITNELYKRKDEIERMAERY